MKNKQILYLVIILLFFSCKSFDRELINPQNNPLDNKLPAMEVVVKNNLVAIVDQSGTLIGASPEDVHTYFDREVTENLTNPYGEKKGTIVLKVSTIDSKPKGMWLYAFGTVWTLTIANVFGLPMGAHESIVEVDLEIMDFNRRLIGKYRGSGHSRVVKGYYSDQNYRDRDMARASYILAVKDAVEEAKTKLIPDIKRLQSELD